MAAPLHSRQHWLDFGAGDHFDLVHGRHLHAVAACTQSGEKWSQLVLPHVDARFRVVELATAQVSNVYMGMAGLRGQRRTVADVAVLPCAFVDLDYYKLPHLAGLDADDLLDRIQAAAPWLPLPTLLVASGRGAYLEWVFVRPLPVDQLHRWQAVEDVVVECLAAFGADPHARDAARVLRPAGSLHLATGLEVAARRVGEVISFEQLENAIMAQVVEPVPPPERAARPGLQLVHAGEAFELLPVAPSRASAAQRAQFIRPYKLAQDRLADYVRLAELRGSPRLRDCRKRLLFAYAVSMTWFASDAATVRDELRAFADRHFSGRERLNVGRVENVVERLAQHQAGVVGVWRGQRVDRRFRLSNGYLVRLLAVSADEQRELRTVVGSAERDRRRVERRRSAGMVEREAYLAKAAGKRQAAREMRQHGLSQAAIAKALGCTQSAVSRMLRHG